MSVYTERVELLCADLETPGLIQGHRHLRRRRSDGSDAWCCLGRACEIYRAQTGDGEWVLIPAEGEYFDRRAYQFVTESGKSALVMPSEVSTFFGFPSSNPELFSRKFFGDALIEAQTLLVAGGWNDHGVPFPEIAAAFRRKYITLADARA